MFLLDTDTLSNITKKNPPSSLLDRLVKTPHKQKFTSTITVGGMAYGAYRKPNSSYFLEKLSRQVWPNINILSFDISSATRYGKLKAELERKGIIIGDPDLQIASIALVNNLIVVTGNVKHFARIPGLSVENWLT